MRIRYSYLSTEGSARENNEDFVAFWEPASDEQWRSHGALVVLADGMGGQVRGEVASRMACEKLVETFSNAAPMTPPAQVLQRGFIDANLAVYDDNLSHDWDWGKMATTLTASLFRNDEIAIAHVGDCRVYLIQQNTIRLITNDHTYAATQQKLGLVSAVDAADSEFRSVLTRSIGNQPFVRPDIIRIKVSIGNIAIQCCDGLWSKVTEGEILSLAGKLPPDQACRELIRLAEKRFADDNLTIQIVHITDIERLSIQKGPNVYWKENDPTLDQDLQPGQVLDDRYQITDLIARSGMASIFKGTDLQTGVTVALKVPFFQYESNPGFFNRFQREQKIGHALDHPYILHLLDNPGQRKSRPYMVMEFLDGQTLGQLMRVLAPMPISDALQLASRICEALTYLHEHDIIHRDLKPDNIMICNDGSIRIMDFGIAKYEGQRRLTFGAFMPAMGTPDYMAPEQVRGKRGDQRTDIYSLGAILYEMLTDRAPFAGENPFIIMNSRVTGDPPPLRQFNNQITPQVEEIVLHAMARSPEARYANAAAMKLDLDSPDKVMVTGRASRLIEPNPLRSGWRKYWIITIIFTVPAMVLLVFWLSRHVQFK